MHSPVSEMITGLKSGGFQNARPSAKNLARFHAAEGSTRAHGATAARRIPDPKVGGSNPSGLIAFILFDSVSFCRKEKTKEFPVRELNPGLMGESHVS